MDAIPRQRRAVGNANRVDPKRSKLEKENARSVGVAEQIKEMPFTGTGRRTSLGAPDVKQTFTQKVELPSLELKLVIPLLCQQTHTSS